MSFGSGGGFGFSQQTGQQSAPFGGFGNSANTNTSFGASTSNTGFGNTAANSNPFGASGGFGSNTGGGFGSSANTGGGLFGNSKPAFGGTSNTSTGGLFGSANTTNTGFGGGGFGSNTGSGFGATNTTNTPSFSFGANTTQPKPAFGGGGLFGQGGTGTTGGFGGNTASSPFGGGGTGTALNQPVGPSEGTGSTPFAATREKEANGGSVDYQSITFQPPYQKYSFEELRSADYNAGRRYGNGSGGTGAFGQPNFSGFGSTQTTPFGGGGLFGGQQTSAGGFGTSTSTTGFGGGGGSLFGSQKSTGSGLFGSGQQSSATTSGGLFGTSGGFGTNTSQPQQSGGLFGASQAKSGGLFGTSGGFGTGSSQPQQSGGLFGNSGNNAGGTLFGTGSNQAQASSLFGSSSQANKPGGLFGTSGGFGTSATQPQQSGGLFGNQGTNTGGGLFGGNNQQNNPQNQGGGLFGSNPTTQSGGLFGGNQQTQQKAGGLFGAGTSGGGLFGAGTQQQTGQGGGGLFGGNQQQNQQQPQQQQGGLFGGGGSGGFGGSNNTGSGLFGGSQQKQGGLFGTSTSTNQGGGAFGASMNQQSGGLFSNLQPQQLQPQQFHASILDPNPYGQSSIWTGLPAATPQNSGPLATPLTASQRLKESQTKPLPSLRFTTSRYMTPPRRNGYGFSYSTYGSPSSAASTPGGGSLTTSMYGQRFTGGSFGRSVGKSFSASNLRSQFSADGESVLSPGAFTPGSSRYSSGSIRRLTIDRNIKSDLFSRPAQPALPAPNGVTAKPTTNGESNNEQPHKLKKRVSFDTDITGGEPNGNLNGETGALVRTETESPESGSADPTPPQSSRGGKNGNASTSSGRDPSRGKELAVVPEDRESDDVVGKGPPTVISGPQEDPDPGEYWMKPSKNELKKFSQEQLQKVEGFQVGRLRCGHVTFNVPADLTTVPIADIFDNIVKITLRSITVYQETGKKPLPGNGLNLPSTLYIENSWPRNKRTKQLIAETSGPAFEAHLRRLKKIEGTHFIEYSAASGVWIFSVDHYTRYALDYDDDDDEEEESQLSSPPATAEQPSHVSDMDVDDGSPEDTDQEDDTFAFKQKIVPGGFGLQSAVVDERDESFSDDGSAAVDSRSEHSYVSEQEESDQEMNMAGSFPQQDGAAEPDQGPVKPILKASQHSWGTPGKPLIDLDGDWTEHLQRTISPRKQNRDALRELQSRVLLDRQNEVVKRPSTVDKKEFRTSIDVMNSLFGKHQESVALSRRKEGGSGFEWPYPKRAKAFHQNDNDMDEATKAWHESFKPNFTSEGTLLYAQSSMSIPQSADWQDERLLAGEGRDLIESTLKSASKQDPYLDPTSHWRNNVKVSMVDGVPFAKHSNTPFSTFVDQMPDQVLSDLDAERQVYQLAHILFDDYEDEFTTGLTSQQKRQLSSRIRKDRLTDFLDVTIARRHYQTLEAKEKENLEEAALWYLSVHDVNGACNCLMKAKDYHLATLVSQIEQADEVFQGDIAEQIEAWKEQNIISEINEPIRALYELLSGNTTICEGKQNVPLEDQASSFTISDRFGFDWLQSFGLCLWYGDQKHGTIEKAVEDYRAKIDSSEEPAWPVANAGSTLESPIWVLLKLYTVRGSGQKPPTLPQDLASLTKPFDVRAAFQLHHALAAHIKHAHVDIEAADKLAADLAFQLSAQGHYIGAAYALLHLSSPSVRKAALKDLLARHAADLPSSLNQEGTSPNDDTIISSILTQDLKIPQQRLHAAKAQYARSRNLSTEELRYLVAAEMWADAHTCLCRRVAPRTVIDEDWNLLAEMLDLFSAKPEEHVGDAWAAGGGIYADFLQLVSGKAKGKEGEVAAKRLSQALEEMGTRFQIRGDDLKAGGSEELEERVACMEMGRLVAGLLVSKGLKGKSVLDLPMTADARLRMAREVGGEEYRRLVGGAK